MNHFRPGEAQQHPNRLLFLEGAVWKTAIAIDCYFPMVVSGFDQEMAVVGGVGRDGSKKAVI